MPITSAFHERYRFDSARVENVGDWVNADYRVVGSGESLNEYNIYLDLVTIRTTDVEGEYELGACP